MNPNPELPEVPQEPTGYEPFNQPIPENEFDKFYADANEKDFPVRMRIRKIRKILNGPAHHAYSKQELDDLRNELAELKLTGDYLQDDFKEDFIDLTGENSKQ